MLYLYHMNINFFIDFMLLQSDKYYKNTRNMLAFF